MQTPPENLIQHEIVEAALRDGTARHESFDGFDYLRFSDDYHGVARGTVLCGPRVLPPYPPIGRIFALARGVRKGFAGPFHAEEKMDGYNVRIARFGDRLLPFTRGGFVCPFTEDRLQDLGEFEALFGLDPDLVLCGEIVGPDNPYMDAASPRVAADIRFFGFDVMRFDRPRPLPLQERDRLLSDCGISTVPHLGWFTADDVPRIRDLVLRLDSEGAEGIILKPPADGLRLKYITPAVNIDDIALDGTLLAEMPAEFFLGRLLRLAMGLEELGLRERVREAEARIGRALVSEFLPVLQGVAAGGKVSKVHEVKFHSDTAADRLLVHLNRASKKVQARELSRRREGDWVYLRFEKTFQESTSRLKTLLDGDYVID